MNVFKSNLVDVLLGKGTGIVAVDTDSDADADVTGLIVCAEASSDFSRVIMLVPRVTTGGAETSPLAVERVQPDAIKESKATNMMNTRIIYNNEKALSVFESV